MNPTRDSTFLNPYFDLYQELIALVPSHGSAFEVHSAGGANAHRPTATATTAATPPLAAIRKKLIWAYAWAIPNAEVISAIAAHSPLLEIGAGTGYWAWLLRQAGADILAIDANPTAPQWVAVQPAPVDPAEPASALTSLTSNATSPFPSSSPLPRTLLLCWPPLDNPMAEEALAQHAGSTLIYIGEWRGRTATARFHDELDRGWEIAQTLEIPRWPGFEDRAYFLERMNR